MLDYTTYLRWLQLLRSDKSLLAFSASNRKSLFQIRGCHFHLSNLVASLVYKNKLLSEALFIHLGRNGQASVLSFAYKAKVNVNTQIDSVIKCTRI